MITPHVMRHTAITKLVQAGVDLPTVWRNQRAQNASDGAPLYARSRPPYRQRHSRARPNNSETHRERNGAHGYTGITQRPAPSRQLQSAGTAKNKSRLKGLAGWRPGQFSGVPKMALRLEFQTPFSGRSLPT